MPRVSTKDGTASLDTIKAGHLTKLLDEDISADVESLHVQKVISAVSELMESLKSYGEDCTSDKHKVKLFFLRAFWLRGLSGLESSAVVVKHKLLLIVRYCRPRSM